MENKLECKYWSTLQMSDRRAGRFFLAKSGIEGMGRRGVEGVIVAYRRQWSNDDKWTPGVGLPVELVCATREPGNA